MPRVVSQVVQGMVVGAQKTGTREHTLQERAFLEVRTYQTSHSRRIGGLPWRPHTLNTRNHPICLTRFGVHAWLRLRWLGETLNVAPRQPVASPSWSLVEYNAKGLIINKDG